MVERRLYRSSQISRKSRPFLLIQRDHGKIIDHQYIGAREGVQHSAQAAIGARHQQIAEQLQHGPIPHVYPSRQAFCARACANHDLPIPAGPVNKIDRCWATHCELLRERINERSQPAGVPEIDVFHASPGMQRILPV